MALRLPFLSFRSRRSTALAGLVVLAILLAGVGAWVGYFHFHLFRGDAQQDSATVEIRMMRGTVIKVQPEGFTFFPTDSATIAPNLTNPRTVVLATSTLILQKGERKSAEQYATETKAYQEQIVLMGKGDATAKAYVLSHPYPDTWSYASMGREAIEPGQEVIVLTKTDVRQAGYISAVEVRIEGVPTYIQKPSVPQTPPAQPVSTTAGRIHDFFFEHIARLLESGAPLAQAASGQHQGNLYWSGWWEGNQFGCDPGYTLVPHHYIDGSTNNAGWYVCVGNNAPTNQSPVGYQDGVDGSCVASGWAQDPDVPSSAISVHFYVDGTFAGATTAGNYRGDLCGGYGCYHGYSFTMPAQFKDNQNHSVTAYAIDSSGAGPNPALGNSPKSFQCAAANNPPYAPSISGPTTLSPNQSGTYSFYSSDPDGDVVGYGVDWNHDGSVDNWIGYPGSSIAHSWPSAGTYTFQALAQDARTANSGWTQYTVTVANLTGCSISLTATPSSVVSGGYSSLSWTSNGVTQGPWATFNNGNAVSTSNPGWGVTPTNTTTYSMSAFGANGQQCNAQTTVTVAAATGCTISLAANPSTIQSGQISNLFWSTTGVASGPWATFNNGNAVPVQNMSPGWNVQPSSNTTYSMSAFGANGQQCNGQTTVTIGAAQACTSSANSCGQTATGVITNGVCNAVTPPNSGCTTQFCKSAPNACGQIADGVITNGVCNAVVPPDSGCNVICTISDIDYVSNRTDTNPITVAPGQTVGIAAYPANRGPYTWSILPSGPASVSGGMDNAFSRYTFNSAGGPYTVTASSPNSGTDSCPTITVVSPTPTCSISASPASAPSTITWSSTGATSCTGGGFSTGNATSGTAPVTANGIYTLSCSGAGGSCPVATATVGVCGGATPTPVITATPARVRAGSTSHITWSGTGISGSCTISGPGLSRTATASACSVASTSADVTVDQQSTYTMTCGSAVSSVTVNLIPTFQEF